MVELLSQILTGASAMVLVAVGVFARVAAVVSLVPGMGERAIPARVKLAISLALTLLLVPMIKPLVPLAPKTITSLVVMIGAEVVAGLVIGLAFRLLVMTLQIAGTIAAQNLTVAQMFGAGVAPEPEPTYGTLLALGGIVLAMAAGLHVQVVAALAQLYEVMPFGRLPGAGTMADWSIERVADTFSLGLSLALPFVAVAFLYNLAMGALARAMPTLVVTMIGTPLLVGLGMGMLYLVLPELYSRWFQAVAQLFANPLGGFQR